MVDLQFFIVDRPLCSFSMKDADNLGDGVGRAGEKMVCPLQSGKSATKTVYPPEKLPIR